jgi:hypothetical protein
MQIVPKFFTGEPHEGTADRPTFTPEPKLMILQFLGEVWMVKNIAGAYRNHCDKLALAIINQARSTQVVSPKRKTA